LALLYNPEVPSVPISCVLVTHIIIQLLKKPSAKVTFSKEQKEVREGVILGVFFSAKG
jgi:hypothetical protein